MVKYLSKDAKNIDLDDIFLELNSPDLVEDCIRSAPPKVVLYGREPKHDVVLEGKRVNFCTFGQGVAIMEPDGTVRDSVNEDVGKAALLTDARPDMQSQCQTAAYVTQE